MGSRVRYDLPLLSESRLVDTSVIQDVLETAAGLETNANLMDSRMDTSQVSSKSMTLELYEIASQMDSHTDTNLVSLGKQQPASSTPTSH